MTNINALFFFRLFFFNFFFFNIVNIVDRAYDGRYTDFCFVERRGFFFFWTGDNFVYGNFAFVLREDLFVRLCWSKLQVALQVCARVFCSGS